MGEDFASKIPLNSFSSGFSEHYCTQHSEETCPDRPSKAKHGQSACGGRAQEQFYIFGVELKQMDWVLLLRLWLLVVIAIAATPPRWQSLPIEHLACARQELSPLSALSPTMHYIMLSFIATRSVDEKLRQVKALFKGLTANKQWTRDLELVTSEHALLTNRMSKASTKGRG